MKLVKQYLILPLTSLASIVALVSCGGQPSEDPDPEKVITPILSAEVATAVEGAPLVFNVNLATAPADVVSVAYDVVAETATAGSDYIPVSGILKFAEAQMTASITVPTLQDIADESAETLLLSFSNAQGLQLNTKTVQGTIYDDDESVPSAPVSLSLVTPASSPSNIASPVIRVAGVTAGNTIEIYLDSACATTSVGASVASSTSVDVTVSSVLTEATHVFYALQKNSVPQTSECSTASLSYELDLTAPAAATSVQLASSYTSNSSTSPLISWVTSISADVVNYQVAIGTSAGAEDVAVFENTTTNSSHTFSSLSLSSCSGGVPVYWPSVKVADAAGNETVAVSASGFRFDNTNPSSPVYAIPLGNAAIDRASTVSWSSASDNCELSSYEVAIGTTPGGQEVLGWKDVGNVTSYQAIDGVDAVTISLSNSIYYYTSVRSKDAVGLVSSAKVSSAWRFVTPPDAVDDLAYKGRSKSSVSLSWTAPNDNGAAIQDYVVEYKLTSGSIWSTYADAVTSDTTVTVEGLSSSTSYDFRVKASNGGTSPVSNVLTQETAPDDPFFDPTVYSAMNLGGATMSAVVAFDDNTELVLNGTTTMSGLDSGQVTVIASAVGDVITSTKPFFAAGRLATNNNYNYEGNIVWNTPDWSGKEFIAMASRDQNHVFTFYAFQDAVVTIASGATLYEDGVTIVGGTAQTFLMPHNRGYKITSTTDIIGYQYSRGPGDKVVDSVPILPPSTDIIGVPSRTGQFTTLASTANFQWWESDGSTSGTDTLTQGVFKSYGGNGSQFSGPGVRAIGDQPLMGRSNADSDGYSSAPFVPKSFQKQRFAVNHKTEWISIVSTEPAVVQVFEPGLPQYSITLSRSGVSDNEPYFGYRNSSVKQGTIFESNSRFAMYYETEEAGEISAANEDETVMFGYDGVGLPVNQKLKLWLDASDSSTLFQQSDCTSIVSSSNDTVGCWKDKSLQGNHVSQSSVSLRPTWTSAVEGFGSQPGLSFDGNDDFMNFNQSIVGGTDYTVFAVVHRSSVKSDNYILGTQSAAPNEGMFLGFSSDTTAVLGQTSNDVSVAISGQTSASVGLIWGRLSSTLGKKVSFNGVTQTDSNTAQISGSANGVIGLGNGSSAFEGQVAEIIVFSRSLSDYEIQLMEEYLREKWLKPSLADNLRLWLDASDRQTLFTNTSCVNQVASSGNSAVCWKDKSGNGYRAIQSAGTAVWNQDSNSDVVQFSNASLTISAGTDGAVFSSGVNLTEVDIFAVMKSASSSETGVLLNHPAGNGLRVSVPWNGTAELALDTGDGLIGGAWGGDTSTYYRWNFVSDDGANEQMIFRDDSLIASDSTASNISIGNESFTLGAANGDTNFQNMNLASILIFDRQLTQKQRHMIRAYLDSKWPAP